LEVMQKKENPLLKRTEVSFKAIHKAEPTPTRDALRAFLARELKATKDIVVIDSQASTFGRYEPGGDAKAKQTEEEAVRGWPKEEKKPAKEKRKPAEKKEEAKEEKKAEPKKKGGK